MATEAKITEVLKYFQICGMQIHLKSQEMQNIRMLKGEPPKYEEVVIYEIWREGQSVIECEVRFHERYTGKGSSKETKWEIEQTYLREDTLGDNIERYDTPEEAVARRAMEIYLMTVVSQRMEIRLEDQFAGTPFTVYLDGNPIGILEYREGASLEMFGSDWEGRLTEALGGHECIYTVTASTRDGACARLIMERFTFEELLAKYDRSKDPSLYQKLEEKRQ